MNPHRLEQLMSFYVEDPNDPFNLYALANEYKTTYPKKALKYFEILLNNHPEYIATYYHLAHLYIELEKDDQAQATFEKGIIIATKNNESLALRELKSAYDEFLM